MKRPMSGFPAVAITGLALACSASGVSAQTALRVSGQLDLTASTRDDLGVNTAFRGDNQFNPVRVRIYAQKWVTDRIGVFTEFFHDSGSGLRVNGAYAVVNSLAGREWLNARLGLAPSPVGAFGLRSTYFNANPLIGVPLSWQYRTNLSSSGTATAASLTGAADAPGPGMPLLYDSCWNIQWELLGELGIFEYSIALSPGSLSSPIRSADVDGQTFMARLGAILVPGVRLGLSAAEGPYLSPGAWEAPLIDEDLEVGGGFVEVRYDLAPAWYLAGRLGGMGFTEIDAGPANGGLAPWDQGVSRTELGLGYRLTRESLIKGDWQRTSTGSSGWTQNIIAVQLSTVF
jgi:hypothetical protein